MDTVQAPTFRQQIWSVVALNRGPTARAYSFASLVLILFSLSFLPLEFFAGLDRYTHVLLIVESVVTALFTLDYLLRVWSAPSRLRYMFSFFGIIDLLSVLPFYLGLLAMPYLRALRVIRLLRLGEIDPAATAAEEQELQRTIGLVEGETVEYIVTRHPVFIVIHSIAPAVSLIFAVSLLIVLPPDPFAIGFSVLLLVFAMILLWKAWLDFSYDVIYVTSHRLIFQDTHLLGRSINQVPYQAIMNIKPSYPSIISYLLRYGSLAIDTASAESDEIRLEMVRHHEKAAHVIMQKSVSFSGQAPFYSAQEGK